MVDFTFTKMYGSTSRVIVYDGSGPGYDFQQGNVFLRIYYVVGGEKIFTVNTVDLGQESTVYLRETR